MLSLDWYKPDSLRNYPKNNFIPLTRLREIVSKNISKYADYLERTPLTIEDNHLLVQLIRHIGIEEDWDYNTTLNYINFKAYALTSMFGIASMSSRGNVIDDGVLGNGYKEIWVRYTPTVDELLNIEKLEWDELTPIRLLYKTSNDRHYINRAQHINLNYPNGKAVIALNIEELVLGWVKFREDPNNLGLGIHTYLIKGPFKNFNLLCNEWSIINSVMSYFNSEDDGYYNVSFENNVFATLDENKLITEYIKHLIKVYEGRRPFNIQDMISQLSNIYIYGKHDIINTNSKGIISQYSWVNEIANIRYLRLYLNICSHHGVKGGDVNTMISRNSVIIKNNFNKIPDKEFREFYLNSLDGLVELNKLNYT